MAIGSVVFGLTVNFKLNAFHSPNEPRDWFKHGFETHQVNIKRNIKLYLCGLLNSKEYKFRPVLIYIPTKYFFLILGKLEANFRFKLYVLSLVMKWK